MSTFSCTSAHPPSREYVCVAYQIFMENASGGFMSDLSFQGGRYGAWLGNQQFTVRNIRFSQCHTAICQHWNWAWTYMDVHITDCDIGLQMLATQSQKQGVGSLVLSDWDVTRTNTVVQLEKDAPGRLVLDNVYAQHVQAIVSGPSRTWLAPASDDDHVAFWVKTPAVVPDSTTTLTRFSTPDGPVYAGACPAPPRPACLVDDNGFWFGQEKPWFARLCGENMVSLRSLGAKGDGTSDDTQAMQAVLDHHRGSLIYGTCRPLTVVPYGHYVITDTLRIPAGTRLVGEAQPVFFGAGAAFQDASHPRPVVQVGVPGDVGDVTLCDLILSTRGPAPGAIVLEWNIHERTQGSVAMFDVHIRLGGFAGSELELAQCPRDAPCEALPHACFLSMHITPKASGYFQNVWVWTADHELDDGAPAQLNVLSDRGILIESQGPVWMYGTASEHALLYQYSLRGASNVLLAMIQTESPYFQGRHFAHASASVQPHAQYPDVDNSQRFKNATDVSFEPDPAMDDRAVGLHIRACKDILVLGAGLYSFFDSYDQAALPAHACQRRLCVLESAAQCERIHLVNVATVGSQCLLSLDGCDWVAETPFREGFCSTMALFTLSRFGTARWL
ncbi:Exo-B-1,3-glucanase (GH55-family)-like protein [Malassezia sympodialis ATCC 42132]|uniref:Exo-B-1,3-glucanase (GH55-family)-like protein n=1 Tax=Malassezia sympodialis (strain ATCC 42132) TaxID=1230383 RepID=UPI0002C1C194|nr:Exo-B-1,3-glucanase (GH55-family)-like protein [Malassezia sympodialis ATCC 42132]CCU98466.1 Exo-B-1,3-glucanase (GH55-family)-like protein [Malassezia sympodialis ATCC 42132]|eukprot:XP_018739772.1 Exo-B-1,3-glucanase (GH55-family)-like protein [Malassezia sympodialis ATCC 42132]